MINVMKKISNGFKFLYSKLKRFTQEITKYKFIQFISLVCVTFIFHLLSHMGFAAYLYIGFAAYSLIFLIIEFDEIVNSAKEFLTLKYDIA